MDKLLKIVLIITCLALLVTIGLNTKDKELLKARTDNSGWSKVYVGGNITSALDDDVVDVDFNGANISDVNELTANVLTVSDTVSGTLYLADGTTTTPGLALDSDPGTGWSGHGAGNLTLRVSSSYKWAYDDDNFTTFNMGSDGSLTIPATSPTTTYNNKLVAADFTSGILTLPQDGGTSVLANVLVTSASTAGNEEGYTFQIDSANALTIVRESDGAGSVRATTTIRAGSFTCYESINLDGDTVWSYFGSGGDGALLIHSTTTPCN